MDRLKNKIQIMVIVLAASFLMLPFCIDDNHVHAAAGTPAGIIIKVVDQKGRGVSGVEFIIKHKNMSIRTSSTDGYGVCGTAVDSVNIEPVTDPFFSGYYSLEHSPSPITIEPVRWPRDYLKPYFLMPDMREYVFVDDYPLSNNVAAWKALGHEEEAVQAENNDPNWDGSIVGIDKITIDNSLGDPLALMSGNGFYIAKDNSPLPAPESSGVGRHKRFNSLIHKIGEKDGSGYYLALELRYEIVKKDDVPKKAFIKAKKIYSNVSDGPQVKFDLINNSGREITYNGVTYADQEIIESKETENGETDFEGLPYHGKYIIREQVPEGYEPVEDFNWNPSATYTWNVVETHESINHYYERTFANYKTIYGDISVSSADADSGKSIGGAVLQILDSNNNVVCEWTGEEERQYKLDDKLITGKRYTIHEKTHPKGYLPAADINITVNQDGTPQSYTLRNKKEADSGDGSIALTKEAGTAEKCSICAGTGHTGENFDWTASFFWLFNTEAEPAQRLFSVDPETGRVHDFSITGSSEWSQSGNSYDAGRGIDGLRYVSDEDTVNRALNCLRIQSFTGENITDPQIPITTELYKDRYYCNEWEYIGDESDWKTHFISEEDYEAIRENMSGMDRWVNEHAEDLKWQKINESDFKLVRHYETQVDKEFSFKLKDGTSYSFTIDDMPEGVNFDDTWQQPLIGGNYNFFGSSTEKECEACDGKGHVLKEMTLTSETGNTEFTFKVLLTGVYGGELTGPYNVVISSDDGIKETGTISSGDTITLKANWKAEITGLPDGASYSIVEQQENNWKLNYSQNENGTTSSAETNQVYFVNNYEEPDEPTDTEPEEEEPTDTDSQDGELIGTDPTTNPEDAGPAEDPEAPEKSALRDSEKASKTASTGDSMNIYLCLFLVISMIVMAAIIKKSLRV